MKITAQLQNGEILDLSLFVKSLPTEEADANFIQEYELFETESFFYSKIIPELEKYCDIAKWATKTYFGNNDILIMEELKNYSEGMIPLPAKHFRAGLSTLARFHASTILTETRLG